MLDPSISGGCSIWDRYSHHRSLTIGFGESVCSMAQRSSSMYSGVTPSGSIAAFSLYCRYLAMDVAVAASWSLLSNQDCISNILASFTGSPSAILTYQLYSSIDLLLHSTFTRRRWFLNGRGEEQCWFWIRTGEERRWFWTGIGEEGRWF